MANKGVLAVEASLKLLRSGADFRLKNKNGQEVLELLEKTENLSTKQMDQVMCDIWARMDSEEQSQELKKTLTEVQGFGLKKSRYSRAITRLISKSNFKYGCYSQNGYISKPRNLESRAKGGSRAAKAARVDIRRLA